MRKVFYHECSIDELKVKIADYFNVSMDFIFGRE